MPSAPPPGGGQHWAVTGAAARWADDLASWAIPPEILDRAPEPPWGFPTALFERAAEQALTDAGAGPSRQRAREALDEGASVLDVGVGGGAGSLPLAPPAALLVGVDQGAEMLSAFAEACERRGVAHREVQGAWPDVAALVEPADVAVCHHVFYNVAGLVPFVEALTEHARRRVVVELFAEHPMVGLNPLWRALHGVERPTSPTASDAFEVLAEMGLPVRYEESERPSLWREVDPAERVAFARRRLCLGPDRDADIEALLPPPEDEPQRLVTLWWDVGA